MMSRSLKLLNQDMKVQSHNLYSENGCFIRSHPNWHFKVLGKKIEYIYFTFIYIDYVVKTEFLFLKICPVWKRFSYLDVM